MERIIKTYFDKKIKAFIYVGMNETFVQFGNTTPFNYNDIVTGKVILTEHEEEVKGIFEKYKVKAIDRDDIFQLIIKTVEVFNNTDIDFSNRTRKRVVLAPIQEIAYFTREHTDYTLEEIGRLCGGRNHATILDMITNVMPSRMTDKKYLMNFKRLERMVEVSIKTGKIDHVNSKNFVEATNGEACPVCSGTLEDMIGNKHDFKYCPECKYMKKIKY